MSRLSWSSGAEPSLSAVIACSDQRLTPAHVTRAVRVVTKLMAARDPTDVSRLLSHVLARNLAGHGPARARSTAQLVCGPYSLDFVNATADLRLVTEAIVREKRATVCLYGPPGTGKTMWAQHLADQMQVPLRAARASDLLNCYVGETEKNIAKLFTTARDEGALLFLDEADSFLQERARAVRSWKITQVNELLVQMEAFDGVFVCATNFVNSLDRASLRRFAMKIEFKALRAEARCGDAYAPGACRGGRPGRARDARSTRRTHCRRLRRRGTTGTAGGRRRRRPRHRRDARTRADAAQGHRQQGNRVRVRLGRGIGGHMTIHFGHAGARSTRGAGLSGARSRSPSRTRRSGMFFDVGDQQGLRPIGSSSRPRTAMLTKVVHALVDTGRHPGIEQVVVPVDLSYGPSATVRRHTSSGGTGALPRRGSGRPTVVGVGEDVPVAHAFLGRCDSRTLPRRTLAASRNLPQCLRQFGVDVLHLAAHAFILPAVEADVRRRVKHSGFMAISPRARRAAVGATSAPGRRSCGC